MKKSKNNKNSFKELYDNINHNKYSQIININGKSELKSSCKNFIYNYKYILLAISVFILLILIYTFRNNPINILYCIIFIFALFLLSMYSSTYKLNLDDKQLKLRIYFQDNIIDSQKLINIYVSKEKMRFLGFPIYNYLLNIIYVENEKPMIITLPTIMTSRKELKKLFSTLEVKKLKDEEEEILEKEKNKKLLFITIFIVIMIVLIVASIVAGIIFLVNK